MLPVIAWIGIFILSLLALVKGADWLLRSAERIGLSFGLSPFVVGVVIVGVGTSLPELASSIVASLRGVGEFVVANAVGSNVANIFLVIGFAAVIGRKLVVDKDLIDLDLPLLATSTALFLGVAYDGTVTFIEALILLGAYFIQMIYTLLYQEEWQANDPLPDRVHKSGLIARLRYFLSSHNNTQIDIGFRDYAFLAMGVVGVVIGSKYLIDSVIAISEIFAIATGAIAIIAVAVGTSLPELFVSVKAAREGKSEVALGNIFGSNAFNVLVVVGLPGLFRSLPIDGPTLMVGIPAMLLATLLFVIAGISRKIHIWEGSLYLLAYILFIGKIFSLF